MIERAVGEECVKTSGVHAESAEELRQGRYNLFGFRDLHLSERYFN